ncbi:MAG TPA: hypothetical protein GX715_19220 [Armatimonadetes bacterium]|nr:hypothetical protein [Armatimonadota bacterium]
MMVELDAQEFQGAIGDAVKVLRQVANDEKQEGETRVEAAVALLEFATHLQSSAGPEGWYEEYEEEEEEK